MTRMVNWSFPSDRFDHTVTSVPEPSTLTLFAVSALALVAVARWRGRAAGGVYLALAAATLAGGRRSS
jgi:hypothetical protein